MAVPSPRADDGTRVHRPNGRRTLGIEAGLRQVSLALVVVIGFSGCGGTSSTTPPLRADAIAVVGDIPIARHQLDVLMKAKTTAIAVATGITPKAGSPQYRQLQDGLVSLLVDVAEARQEARQLGIRVAPSRVDAATRQLEQKFGEHLTRRGLTKAELRLTAEFRTLSGVIAARVGTRTQVTASEVAHYYRTHIATYTRSPSRTLALILVRSQALAIRLGHELETGAAIAPLARRYSLDRTSAKNGGTLTTTASTLTRPLSKVAFALKTAAVSAPTQTAFGWAIVKALTPIRPARRTPLKRLRAQIHHDLLESERTQQTATWFGEQTTRYCRSGLTFRRGFMPAGLCTGTTTDSLVAPASSGAGPHVSVAATTVALYKQRWLQLLSAARSTDRAARFPSPSRALLLKRLHPAQLRYGFEIARVRVYHVVQAAPVVVIRSNRKRKMARAVAAIVRRFDPRFVSKANPSGYAYEGFFLVVEDKAGKPYLLTFNYWRGPNAGGGQWAANKDLYPYPHG